MARVPIARFVESDGECFNVDVGKKTATLGNSPKLDAVSAEIDRGG